MSVGTPGVSRQSGVGGRRRPPCDFRIPSIFGGLLLYYSFLGNGAPDAGWFAYAPLSSQFTFTANAGMNYWGVSLLTMGIGTLSAGVNIMATVLTMRAPGMTMRRVPLFVWMS